MELEEAIRTRRTHKAYAPEPLDRETLDELFELARWAPNHKLTNPWRFRVVGPQALERLKQAAGDPIAAAKLDRAPTLVAVSATQTGDPVMDEEDVLAAGDRGLRRAARRARPRPGGLLAHAGRAAHAGGARGARRPRRRARARACCTSAIRARSRACPSARPWQPWSRYLD